MLFLLRKEQRRPVSLSCLLGIVANNPEERGVGSGKRGGRGFSAQLWENKGSVSGPLGLGAAFTCCWMVGGWWGGVEEHGDGGGVGHFHTHGSHINTHSPHIHTHRIHMFTDTHRVHIFTHTFHTQTQTHTHTHSHIHAFQSQIDLGSRRSPTLLQGQPL